jgi:hypothetical protein
LNLFTDQQLAALGVSWGFRSKLGEWWVHPSTPPRAGAIYATEQEAREVAELEALLKVQAAKRVMDALGPTFMHWVVEKAEQAWSQTTRASGTLLHERGPGEKTHEERGARRAFYEALYDPKNFRRTP